MAERTATTTQHIKERLDLGEQWYAILEGAHTRYPMPELLYEHWPRAHWLPLYRGTRYDPDLLEVSPLLVQLDDPQQCFQDWQTHFPGLPACLVASKEPMETIAAHLQTLLSVRRPTGRREFFRFHDARIAPAVHATLNERNRERWQGPISLWLWQSPDGPYTAAADRHHADAASPTEEGWLLFDDTLERAVAQAGSASTADREGLS